MKKAILLLYLLFAFTIFAQESGPSDFPMEFPGTFEPIPPPEPELGQAQQPAIPSKKDPATAKPEAVSRVEVKTEDEVSNVFLDFRDADIREVARILSKISGVSILIGEDVEAKVTLNIEGVTWKRALELILRTYNLTMIEKDDFIIVVTYEKIQQEQEQVPLKTEILRLNFVDIEAAKKYLKSVLSKRGVIEGDARTNSLIITDTPESIEKAIEIAQSLDISTPQVLIEVLMVDKKITDEFSLGIDWSLTDLERVGLDTARSYSQELPISSQVATFTYGVSLFGHAQLQATIKAIASDAEVDIVANPRILTLDNVNAIIKIVEQIPYTSESQSTEGAAVVTSTQFKDTGVTLDVKPHITPDGHIILDVKTEQSFSVGTTEDGEPIIDSRTSESTMMVMDGYTIVIGGLRKKNDETTTTKVPLLGDIPFIGKLFTREITTNVTREFLIFITPTVIREPLKVAGVEENKKVIAESLAHDMEQRNVARALIGYQDHSVKESPEVDEETERKEKNRIEKERLGREKSEAASRFYQMARSSYKNKDYLKAQELFTKAYDLDPNYKDTSRYLKRTAKAIVRQDQLAKAKQETERKEKNRIEKERLGREKIKENLAEFDNLDILPLKGPDEAN